MINDSHREQMDNSMNVNIVILLKQMLTDKDL